MHNHEQAILKAAPPPHDFGLLEVSGPQAKKFLQGQLTCNMEEVSDTQSRLGAHCNPQGRVQFLFRIFYNTHAYYLVLPHRMAAPALQCLKKYAIFFQLALRDRSEDMPMPLLQQAVQEWRYFDIRQGIPQIYPETSGLFLPHDLNLHQLQGLSWDKGCYTGQEIIARMHYRGKLKNQLFLANIQTAAQPKRGAEIYCQHPGFQAAGFLIDYRPIGHNQYELLVVTSAAHQSNPLRLDPQQNETWEWLSKHD